MLLGRPWLYDRKVKYDGFKNIYPFEKDGHKMALAPLKPSLVSKPSKGADRMLVIEMGIFKSFHMC